MRHLSLVLVALATLACVRTQTNPATGRTDVDVEPPTKSGEDWSGNLSGQSGFAVSGSTKAMVANGETVVNANIRGAMSGGSHPWHVHEGKCGSGGAIVGNPSAYPPLTVGADGTAQGSARLALELNEAKDYYVNVHASASDLATIVACGDLDD